MISDKNEKHPTQTQNIQYNPEETEKCAADTINELEDDLGYIFNNKELLREAQIQAANKKTAFFGDAVLDFIVSEYLFCNYPELEQGQLTNLKSLLVCDEKLEKIVKINGWDDYLIVEKGISEKSKKMNSTFLEAIVGAIYLDGDLKCASHFINKFIVNKKEAEKEMKNLISPKVRLYEFCQQNYGGYRPESYVVSEDGPPHDKIFEMGYTLPKEITNLEVEIVGTGIGKTKADAETRAAEKVNKKLIQLGLMEQK